MSLEQNSITAYVRPQTAEEQCLAAESPYVQRAGERMREERERREQPDRQLNEAQLELAAHGTGDSNHREVPRA